jgi:hypothetical protein
MANYTSVLTMLLRMRQACDHPSLVTASLAMNATAAKLDEVDDADDLADMLSGLGVGGKKCEVCFTR